MSAVWTCALLHHLRRTFNKFEQLLLDDCIAAFTNDIGSRVLVRFLQSGFHNASSADCAILTGSWPPGSVVSLYTYRSSSFSHWHVFQNMSLLAMSRFELLLLQNVWSSASCSTSIGWGTYRVMVGWVFCNVHIHPKNPSQYIPKNKKLWQ